MPDLYGRLIGKRYPAGVFFDDIADSGMHICDYVLASDIDMEPVDGYASASWDTGFGDLLAVPDPRSLRPAGWLDRTAVVLCDLFRPGDRASVAVAPRTLLAEQVARAAQAGFTPRAASELEFFLFEKRPEPGSRPTPFGRYVADYQLLETAPAEPVLSEIREALVRSGVEVECTKGEWGIGQHELNLRHCEIREMADRHVVYKHVVKELALRAGLGVTFMAKWDSAAAGNSGHVHLSLWRDGANAFAPGPNGRSPVLESFLAGLLEHLRAITLFLAPYPNSYKRFRNGSFAPTTVGWAQDNRTAALRVVGSGAATRIECRVGGADINPYVAFAAILAAGLDGVERGRALPEAADGDQYRAQGLEPLPETLAEAIACAEASEMVVSAFGKEVVEHYAHFSWTEERVARRVVTDWERERYLERI